MDEVEHEQVEKDLDDDASNSAESAKESEDEDDDDIEEVEQDGVDSSLIEGTHG